MKNTFMGINNTSELKVREEELFRELKSGYMSVCKWQPKFLDLELYLIYRCRYVRDEIEDDGVKVSYQFEGIKVNWDKETNNYSVLVDDESLANFININSVKSSNKDNEPEIVYMSNNRKKLRRDEFNQELTRLGEFIEGEPNCEDLISGIYVHPVFAKNNVIFNLRGKVFDRIVCKSINKNSQYLTINLFDVFFLKTIEQKKLYIKLTKCSDKILRMGYEVNKDTFEKIISIPDDDEDRVNLSTHLLDTLINGINDRTSFIRKNSGCRLCYATSYNRNNKKNGIDKIKLHLVY